MAKEVGGDFYDFITITPQRVGFAIGDVSGKGVSAALVMSNVMSSLRSLLAAEPSRGPADLLVQLNKVLHRATAADRFVTLFYAEYDLATASLRYANAGHDWPMVVSPEGHLVLDLESSGLMLGALPEVHLTEHEIKLEPGDVVVAYSDGLVDTMNESGEPFDRERAQAVIADRIGESPSRLVEAVSARLREWQGRAEDVDDVTIVVLKRVALPGVEQEALEAASAARR
jgi:sigma-B regulation protein RsbU (phosphoserine phosphatase)